MFSSAAGMFQRVDALRQLLQVDVCSLYRAWPGTQVLELVASSGLNQRALGVRLAYAQGLTGKVARTEQPVAARDVAGHPEYFHVSGSDEERYKSYLGIPLHHAGALVGVLVIQTRQVKTFFVRDIKALHHAGSDLVPTLVLAAEAMG